MMAVVPTATVVVFEQTARAGRNVSSTGPATREQGLLLSSLCSSRFYLHHGHSRVFQTALARTVRSSYRLESSLEICPNVSASR